MKYLHIITLLLFLSASLGIHAQRVPSWVKRLPSPDNNTYLYDKSYGVGASYKQASDEAVAKLFQSTLMRLGMPVDAADISRALQEGRTVQSLSRQFQIPINIVCEYRRNVTGGVEVHLLAQVAVAGNIDVMFTSFRKCEEHLSDAVPYIDNDFRLDLSVLHGSASKPFEGTDMREDDYFFVRYHSNRAGFVSVWLEDEDGIVQRLLPFRGNNPVALDANRTYLLFSEETASLDGGMQYQATISNGRRQETNRLHIVYSPYDFLGLRTQHQGRSMPESASRSEFQTWYEAMSQNNPGTIIKTQEITIKK
ncbi:MAG: hypothetical protein II793_00545 [Bacteroidales bacterium]|nr:hypothetical protein [Bacteroidales bacterium]